MDEKDFSDRVMKNVQKLYRIANTILKNDADCADALQEALIIAWTHRHKLRDDAFFDTWLIRILINECKRMYRKRKRFTMLVIEAPTAKAPPNAALREALDSLDEKYRLPLMLHHLEGYSVEEISSILHLPANTVKTRLRRARLKMKERLEREEAAK